jgi:farnesol dehydrogenase
MKIFVTGATGFIGEHLVRKLISEGQIVHAIYRSELKITHLQHENIRWFKGDIMNIASLELAMLGCEQVYHIAALAAAWEPSPGDFRKYNVQGTVNVLEAAHKCRVQKIVVTSTAGIFGPSIQNIITEKSVSSMSHFTGYELSKAESERVIAGYVKTGMNIVIVNPTRVFGPGILNESNSVTIMIKKYIDGKWHFIPGNGESIGNYVFVNDVVNGHILAMEKGKSGERYILGGDNVSYNQFFRILEEQTDRKTWMVKMPLFAMLSVGYFLLLLNKLIKIRPAFTPDHVRKFNYNWEVSSNNAINDLGYKITPFGEAVKATLETLKKKECL